MRVETKKACITFAVAFIICAIYYIWIFQFYELYMHRDDAMMRAIASGTYSGTPDGHLIYIKYVYGFLLTILYTVLPTINWYGICYMTIGCVGMALILWKLYKMDKRGILHMCWVTFVFLSLYTIYVYPILVGEMNFTYIAGFCGVTSVFYLVTSEVVEKKRGICLDLLISALFAGMTLLIREEVFWITLAVIVCYVAFKSIKSSLERKELLKYSILIAMIFICVSVVENIAYGSGEWKSLREYDDNRSMMVDYYGWEGYDKYAEIYDEYGVTREGARLMDYWFLSMDDVDMHGLLEELVKYEEELWEGESIIKRVETALIQFYNHFFSKEYAPRNFCLILLVVLLLSNAFYKKDGVLKMGFIFFSGGLYVLMWLYLLYRGRIQERACVTLQLIFMSLFFGMLIQSWSKNENVGGKLEALLIRLFFSGCLLYMVGYHILYFGWGDGEKDKATEVTQYCTEHSEEVFLITDGGYAVERRNQFMRDDGAENIIYAGGWLSNSPLFDKKLENCEVEKVLDALITKENMYYIDCDIDLKDRLAGYYAGEGLNVVYETVDDIEMKSGDVYHVYRFCEVDEE